ncbi:MAG: ATP-binding protein, partial [Verrucomicrobiales bacterium]|nr:ATP-binding protein [Verrucomicrobiales bacterium]
MRSIEEIDIEVLSPMEQEAWRANLRQRLRAEIPAFLMRLCVDPGMRMPGEQRVRVPDRMTVAELPGFKDVVSCLVAIMNRSRRDASAGTAVTSVGKIVSDHLDFCRNTREMVVICGREGIGKTAAMTTWLKRNQGDVRRITLTATNNQTEFFRALASTLGVAASYTRKVDEMKGRCADMLQSSGLMLVIDEAHQILPRGKRVETTPVLLEWIYSALRDEGVPVALVCTPQFRIWAANIQKRTGWNADQFLRRT